MTTKFPSIRKTKSVIDSFIPISPSSQTYCNIKNAVCLNRKKDHCKFLRDVKSVMKNNQQIFKLYSYYYTKKKEEHSYKLLFKKKHNNLKIVIGDADGWNDKVKCLTMTFYKPDKYFLTFESSKIHQINKGTCGRKHHRHHDKEKREMSGGYILNLANKLNDLLNVTFSKLQDDSKIIAKDCNLDKYNFDQLISLKMIELIKYGKTWYERAGGFSLDDKKYYKLVKIVEQLTLAKTLEYTMNKLNRSLGERPSMRDSDLIKLDKILKKLKVGRNIKMKNLFLKAFSKESPLSLCEQYHLYNMSLLVPYRKLGTEDYNKLHEFSKLHLEFSDSTRINKKKTLVTCDEKMPIESSINRLPPLG